MHTHRLKENTHSSLRFLFLSLFGVAGFVGLVLLLYATSIQSGAGTSDKATTILVGQAIGNGHLLLRGWILPPGNYWTTDAATYAVAIDLFGLRPGLLYAEPAAIGALVIAVGVLLAREGRRGAAAIVGGLTVVVLLGFSTPAMAMWFVGKGFHIETALYVLVAFGALHKGKFGLGWIFSVALLAFGMIGDLEIVAFAAIPLLLGGLFAMVRQRRWQSGMAMITAGIASAVIGKLAEEILNVIGAFKSSGSLPLAHFDQMLTNFRHVFTYSSDLLGITNGHFGDGGSRVGCSARYAIGGAVVVACLLAALVNLITGMVRGNRQGEVGGDAQELWRLDDLLLLATFGSTAPFILLAGANGVGIHFLSVPVVFASILTARMLARLWPKLKAGVVVRGLSIVGIATSLTFAAGLGYGLSRPTPTSPASSLALFLETHHLHTGIGGYWTSTITTVESGGAVTIRPVGIGLHGVRPMSTQSNVSWYDGQRFQFVVTDVPDPNGVGTTAIRKIWGAPAHIYRVGQYRIYVWNHGLRVAPYPPT